MVPNVAKTGTSFKGAALYYLHDKREAWEAERMTADRVGWTATRNLATDNPDLAMRIMAATAMDQDRLKAEAGVKATGRKSAASVYVYSLAWHPDEARTLSKSEMLRAADESLRAIGAQDRQAVIVCHRDEKHPHIHVIVNRVSQEDGRMLSTSNDRVKLSQWAEAYERERGRIWCDQRVANNAKRAQGDFIRASSLTPRSMEKDFDRARGSNDNQAKKARDEAKARAAQIAADGAAARKRHSTEWEVILKRYKDRRAEIYTRSKAAGEQVRAAIKDQYRPQWRDLFRTQDRELNGFERREQSVTGKLANVLDALKGRAIGEGDRRSFLAAGFNFLTSRKQREAEMVKRHKAEQRKLAARQSRETDQVMKRERADRDRFLKSAQATYQADRAALVARQAEETAAIKARWRAENDRRGRAFKTVIGAAQTRQNARSERSAPEAMEQTERRRTFKQAANGEARKMGRRRRRRTRRNE